MILSLGLKASYQIFLKVNDMNDELEDEVNGQLQRKKRACPLIHSEKKRETKETNMTQTTEKGKKREIKTVLASVRD